MNENSFSVNENSFSGFSNLFIEIKSTINSIVLLYLACFTKSRQNLKIGYLEECTQMSLRSNT